ncbi:conserved hypothetical protein [Mycobacterium ulcerans Agy99]|uniref:Uncharacterized protein n=1 Tax=Mycobacterium ulcerans (strain Agy99) TaxID=362242 RepID=A0PQW9_MYCUA|nr:conserved hypothetical protein [Mycobacterium ulcerans Agy99]
MLAPAARELSAIAAVGRICLLAGALATGFHQAYAAGMDALQGSGVNEGAVAGAGGAGMVKLPRHQLIAIGRAEIEHNVSRVARSRSLERPAGTSVRRPALGEAFGGQRTGEAGGAVYDNAELALSWVHRDAAKSLVKQYIRYESSPPSR